VAQNADCWTCVEDSSWTVQLTSSKWRSFR
jgi:hypothetical protein